MKRFDIDTRILRPKTPAQTGQELPDGSFVDAWGVKWEPTGVGTYHVVGSPFQKELSLSVIDKYPWPQVNDLVSAEGLQREGKRLYNDTDFGIVLSLPTGIIHQAQFLRGYEGWLMDVIEKPGVIETLFQKLLGIWIMVTEKILDEAGKFADVVTWGDDLAFQDCTIVSPELYRKIIKPYQKKMFEFVKSRSHAKILFHSCGAVLPLISDLIDMGVDILNPVQVSAKGMDTAVLKRNFGDNLCFWGAIDTHYVLSRGSTEDVKKEVKRRIGDLAENGGYVLASVHNIQRDVPPENICAMFDSAREYGRC